MIELDNNIVIKIAESIWESGEKGINIDNFGLRFLKNIFPEASQLEINNNWNEIRKKVIHEIHHRISQCSSKGILPKYIFSDYSDVIILRCDLLSKDSVTKKRNYIIIECRKKIKDTLYKIGWRDFEFFCAHLLSLYGCIDLGVTHRVRDRGIDFYGTLNLDLGEEFQAFSKLIEKSFIRIVGSAKKWKRQVGEAEIDRFIKKYRDLYLREGRGKSQLPQDFLDENSLIYAMCITTSYFSRDAKEQAKKNGIIIKNGEQIAEDLILLSENSLLEIWFKEDDGKIVFNETTFINWIKRLKNHL